MQPACPHINYMTAPSTSRPALRPLGALFSPCHIQKLRRWRSTSVRPLRRVSSDHLHPHLHRGEEGWVPMPMHRLMGAEQHHAQEPVAPTSDVDRLRTPAGSHHLFKVGSSQRLPSGAYQSGRQVEDSVQHLRGTGITLSCLLDSLTPHLSSKA